MWSEIDQALIFCERASPGDDEYDDADADVGAEDADPNLLAERLEEGEEAWALEPGVGLLDQDGDLGRHERGGEIDHLLPSRTHCQRTNRHLSLVAK